MNIQANVTSMIGDTPLVYLNRIGSELDARVAVKMESYNPGGSVKDRIGVAMIEAAERDGLILPGKTTIVEPTSGNTGIALAMVGAARGYRVIITMPESMSVERRRLLAAYGAELVLTPAGEGMLGAIQKASEILESDPETFMPGQFDNPANPEYHYRTTGPEIDDAVSERRIGALVAGVGTGGTVSGAGRCLKSSRPGIQVVAVEPAESPVITQVMAGEEPSPSPHMIQGIGAGFIPKNLDIEILDEVLQIKGEDAIAMGRRLAVEEGLMLGISSGANVLAALEVAQREEMADTVVVTIGCSTGERYLSTALWEGLA